jgi:uncharacterized protein (TIGR03083 family)
MSSRTAELFNQGLDFFTAVLTQVVEADWERPSRCAGWTARDLLGHLASTVWSASSSRSRHRDRARPRSPRPGLRGDHPRREPGIRAQGRNTRRRHTHRRIPRLDRPSITLSVRGSAAE